MLGSVTKPAYWVGSQRKLCNIGNVNSGWQNSGVHGLDLDGNNVYQAGWVMNFDGQYQHIGRINKEIYCEEQQLMEDNTIKEKRLT